MKLYLLGVLTGIGTMLLFGFISSIVDKIVQFNERKMIFDNLSKDLKKEKKENE